MTNESSTGKDLFQDALVDIRGSIQRVARRNRLEATETEDFASYVLLKLVEDDYRRLRRFRARSGIGTYLSVVIQRLLLDFRTARWGKWRASAKAREIGETAVQLEALLYRDGLRPGEARQVLEARLGAPLTSGSVQAIVEKLPRRVRCRRVDEHLLQNLAAEESIDPIERAERDSIAEKTAIALGRVVRGLSEEDKRFLALRFVEGYSLTRAGGALGTAPRNLQTRMRRLLHQFRDALETADVTRSKTSRLWDWKRLDLNLRRILEEPTHLPERNACS